MRSSEGPPCCSSGPRSNAARAAVGTTRRHWVSRSAVEQHGDTGYQDQLWDNTETHFEDHILHPMVIKRECLEAPVSTCGRVHLDGVCRLDPGQEARGGLRGAIDHQQVERKGFCRKVR